MQTAWWEWGNEEEADVECRRWGWRSAENQTPAPTTWPCPAMPRLDNLGRPLSWTIQEDLRSTPTPGSASSGWGHAKQSSPENKEKDRFSAFWLRSSIKRVRRAESGSGEREEEDRIRQLGRAEREQPKN